MSPHVYLATPTRDWTVHAAFCDARTATIEALLSLGWSYTRVLGPPGAADVFVARALLAESFLASRADYLFFLDGDLAFQPAAVERVVRYDRPLVGAFYCTREHDWSAADRASARGLSTREASARMRPALVLYPDPANPGIRQPRIEENGRLIEAAYVPGGFMCLRRDTLETMRAHALDVGDWMTYRGTKLPSYFEPFISGEHRARVGEDIGFCLRWRALGGEVWADTGASFSHIGPCEYVSPSLASAFDRVMRGLPEPGGLPHG